MIEAVRLHIDREAVRAFQALERFLECAGAVNPDILWGRSVWSVIPCGTHGAPEISITLARTEGRSESTEMAVEGVMKIALIQQSASHDRESNVQSGIDALEKAAGDGARLVVYPELGFLRFFPQRKGSEQDAPWAETVPGPTTDRFAALARRYGVVVVLNLYEREGQNLYDSSPVIDSDGSLLGVTRMVHIMEGPCFHEKDFYHPGDRGAPVFDTSLGPLGVAICYDRHYPEYMRTLALKGAQLVVVPQAGAVDEWPPGVFEAELQAASFQNGYFAALANRVGEEECLTFAGESFVTDPMGRVVARAPRGLECILYADLDLTLLERCSARRHFLPDRRPEAYPL
jgi:N-carbamoylputrescine amidase